MIRGGWLHRLFVTAVCLSLSGTWATARTPAWLVEAMSRRDAGLEAGQDAVILHDEAFWDYTKRGRVELSVRFAVRVLEEEGRRAAVFVLGYDASADKLRSLEGWVLHEGVHPFPFRRRDCVDVADSLDELYSDYRTVRYSAADEARVGTVFAYEFRISHRSLFAERSWFFNTEYPVLHSSLEARAPKGWGFRYDLTNEREAVKMNSSGELMRWTASSLAAFVGEEGGSSGMYRTRLRLTVVPDSEGARSYPLLSWDSWPAVAAYVSDICHEPSRSGVQVAAKARELTAGLDSDGERIQAIAEYVQRTRYVAISVDLGKGGGFKPHDAEAVLRANYGDCKDKVNLMRALLGVVGIESYPVIVLADAARWIDPRWPSPAQFNHAIIGIRTEAQPHWEAVVKDDRLGSLLIFDPTDESLSLGHLPYQIQGTRALLGLSGSELFTLPRASPENHFRQDELEGVLHPNGDIEGVVRLDRSGLMAGGWRRARRLSSPSEFEKQVIRALGTKMRNLTTGDLLLEDGPPEQVLSMSTSFVSLGYARSMRDRLLILDPDLLGRGERIPEKDLNRRTDLRLDPKTHRTRTSIVLPGGYVVDELPPPVELENPWARFRLSVSVDGQRLVYEREEVWKQAVVPADQYEEYRGFLRDVRDACKKPVVLVRI